jgi:hypothetical protein
VKTALAVGTLSVTVVAVPEFPLVGFGVITGSVVPKDAKVTWPRAARALVLVAPT